MSKRRFAKIFWFAVVIAMGSVSFVGPMFAAMKLGSAHLTQLAGSAALESPVLALLGTSFLIFASAVRRSQASTKESLP